MQQAIGALAPLERRHADPQRMPGPRQRDIQQAQVLAQPVLVGHSDLLGRGLKVQTALACAIGQADEAGAGFGDRPEARGKGQKHQRIFQPLGLVHRHQLDQVSITL